MNNIETLDAPRALGPYSQATVWNEWVFLSGQLGLLPETGELISGKLEDQLNQIFKNLHAILRAAGGQLSDIVKLTLYMRDLDDFPTVNAVMEQYFSMPFPARATIEVSQLPKKALIEVEGIAIVRSKKML